MNKKLMLITGATDGIGKEAAIQLASSAVFLVLIGRNRHKMEKTISEITAKTGNRDLDFFICDLSSQIQIREFAAAFRKKYSRIDVLINNAGAMFAKRQVTEDNLEMTFALDHLAYFLLTLLLIDLIKKSAPARIINVSSGMHKSAHLDFDDLMSEKSYNYIDVYSKAKLANVVFTKELASRLKGNGVTVNCLHPGFVRTNFMNSSGGLYKLFGGAAALVGAIRVGEGAKTTVYLAQSPKVENVTGEYFYKCTPSPYNPEADSPEVRKRLWEISCRLVDFNSMP